MFAKMFELSPHNLQTLGILMNVMTAGDTIIEAKVESGDSPGYLELLAAPDTKTFQMLQKLGMKVEVIHEAGDTTVH